MLNIRDAGENDIPLIRKLADDIWPQTYSGIISREQIDYMLGLMYSASTLDNQMKAGVQFIIVTDNDAPVGFAAFRELKAAHYKLDKIYILPSQQGKGTGRFVIGYILTRLRSAGVHTLELQVNRNNKAKDFYSRLGFIIREEYRLDIGNGFYMDDYIMEKAL